MGERAVCSCRCICFGEILRPSKQERILCLYVCDNDDDNDYYDDIMTQMNGFSLRDARRMSHLYIFCSVGVRRRRG